jgi:glycosyltransferase involved in cell wall biosynthesis
LASQTNIPESTVYDNFVSKTTGLTEGKQPPPPPTAKKDYPHTLKVQIRKAGDADKFAKLLQRTIHANKSSFVFTDTSRFKPENWQFVPAKKSTKKRQGRKRREDPNNLWVRMPDFDQANDPPYTTFTIRFNNKKQFVAFARRIKQPLRIETKSIWYPVLEADERLKSNWVSQAKNTNPRYPVYIVSKGRGDTRKTSRALERMGVPYYIAIEPQDYDEYSCVIDESKILVLPFSNHGDGPGRARNWCWDHAISLGAKRHWVMDDNLEAFYRLNENARIKVADGAMFRAAEDFVDRYENVPVAGFNYRFFVAPRQAYPPFVLNTRIYSCLLIENKSPYRWRGRYNEDTDQSLRVLKDGLCTIQFNAFLQGKMGTSSVDGGNTAEFYDAESTWNKSKMLEDMHPDVASVVWRYGRWHHEVNYEPFKGNALIPKKGVKIPSGDPYKMELVSSEKSNPKPVKGKKAEILMPVLLLPTLGGTHSEADQKIITGGCERFSKQLMDLFPQIAPIYITKDDRTHRRSKKLIKAAVEESDPKIIIINEPWSYNNVRDLGVPVILIFHEPLYRDIRMVNLGNIFKKMLDDGVHIYFVSKIQFAFHQKIIKRIQNVDIRETDIMGFVSPSYCKSLKFSKTREYDSATIGRSDIGKNPFRLHQCAKGTDLKTLVMTNDAAYRSNAQNAYVAKNADWEYPQITMKNLEHTKVIKTLSRSKSFVSTCPNESWGITAMEALGCGVPVILITNNDTDTHASEDIAADPSHYRKIKLRDAKKGLMSLVRELSDMPVAKRREIYEATNEKYSEKNWKKRFQEIFRKRLVSR